MVRPLGAGGRDILRTSNERDFEGTSGDHHRRGSRAWARICASIGRLGAKVVVNDLGASLKGEGENRGAADAVVDEIRAAGGEAVASFANVADEASAAGIVETASTPSARSTLS